MMLTGDKCEDPAHHDLLLCCCSKRCSMWSSRSAIWRRKSIMTACVYWASIPTGELGAPSFAIRSSNDSRGFWSGSWMGIAFGFRAWVLRLSQDLFDVQQLVRSQLKCKNSQIFLHVLDARRAC